MGLVSNFCVVAPEGTRGQTPPLYYDYLSDRSLSGGETNQATGEERQIVGQSTTQAKLVLDPSVREPTLFLQPISQSISQLRSQPRSAAQQTIEQPLTPSQQFSGLAQNQATVQIYSANRLETEQISAIARQSVVNQSSSQSITPAIAQFIAQTDEELAEETVPDAPTGTVISEIQVRFVDAAGQPTEGVTRAFIITREFDLQAGDPYNRRLVEAGLQRLERLDSVRQAAITLESSASDRVVMVVTIVERPNFRANLNATAPFPTALQGPQQSRAVTAGADIDGGLAIGGSIGWRNLGGNDQNLLLRVTGGENVLNGELSFTDPWIGGSRSGWGYGINVFNQRAVQAVYTGGDRDVDLPNGDTPWVHRIGGGVQVFRPFNEQVRGALGVSYQQVAVRNDMFSDRRFSRDERDEPLTFSDRGQDDLLTVNLALDFDYRNDRSNPTEGSRLLLGVDQAIPIGEARIAYTRLSGRYLQYLPLPLFGFADGDRTLILSLQGGTMLGDVPGYEAFNVGSGIVRGFSGDGMGTGSSFVQATAEYRFPIANFNLFRRSIALGGSLFADYASDLGTADEVLGRSAIVRDKPGNGFGYGIGLRAEASIGTIGLEFAWNDNGGNEVIFSIGDRF